MTWTPRPYQAKAIEDARAAIKAGKKRILIVAPTGTGKGDIIASILKGTTDKGNRSLFAVHRRELVKDIANRLNRRGVYAGVILPGERASSFDKCIVGSIQSINPRMKRKALEIEDLKVLVIDEAHRFNPKEGMYKTLTDQFPDAIVIGFTATPCRQDGTTLAEFFEVLIQPIKFSEAFDQGFLVRPQYFAAGEPDLSDVKTVKGDYDLDRVDEIMGDDALVGDVVQHYARHATGRQAVLFAPRRHSARLFQQRFIAAGFIAEYVDGNTPTEERDAIFAGMKDGTIEILCSVDVPTEGWDEPRVSVMIWCRPTKSVRLWLQAAGRILRPCEGKTDALIFDHAGTLGKLGFIEEYEDWTLDGKEKAYKKKKVMESLKEGKLVSCENCGQEFSSSPKCPSCGWVIPPSQRTEELFEIPVDLVRQSYNGPKLAGEYSVSDKHTFYQMLLWIAESNGNSPGWAAHKFKAKFGAFPHRSRNVTSVAPNAEVVAFVQAEKRKWMKSSAGQDWKAKSEARQLQAEIAVGITPDPRRSRAVEFFEPNVPQAAKESQADPWEAVRREASHRTLSSIYGAYDDDEDGAD